MDRISQLPDELILRILSSLPTKHAVDTIFLSKRWQFLWTMVPKLVHDYTHHQNKSTFPRFVERSLLLHEAPTIKALHLKLGPLHSSKDIGLSIRPAERRCVRELVIEIDSSSGSKSRVALPTSLYTRCKMLVTLELSNAALKDDASSQISFPSLKNLSIKSMKFPSGEFVDKLLSGCPVLEDLVVEQRSDDKVPILSVRVLHLKRLVLRTSKFRVEGEAHGFVIDAPSLENLDIVNDCKGFCVIANDMSKIVSANVVMTRPHTEHILGSITSAKRLHICLPTTKNAYLAGSVFCNLVVLKICTCGKEWSNLLMRVLSDAPILQSLKREQYHDLKDNEPRLSWSEPSSVPECLLSSLKNLKWVNYRGTKEEKEVAAFILRSANCLGNVTINPKSNSRKKFKMIKELSFLPRRSPTCQIVFD